MFGVIGWIVFGLIVGFIAKLLMPGRDPGGFIITMLLGIVGAVVGGMIGRGLGWYGPNQGAGFLMSLLGSIILLAMLTIGSGFDAALLPAIAVLAPPYIVGCLAGTHLTGRLPDALVRRVVLLLVVVIALVSLML